MELHHLFFIIVAVVNILMVFIVYKRGKASIEIFPPIDSVNVLFQEKRASGYSTKSWSTRLGGINNALEIVVTNNELWVRIPWIVAGFAKTHELLHRVNLKNILFVESKKKNVTIVFESSDGLRTELKLMLKGAELFVQIIEEQKNKIKKAIRNL